MASRIDSNDKGKTVFKKRAHRPWKPALLETIIQSPQQDDLSSEPENEHEDIDALSLQQHDRLENSLAEKAKERDELVHQLHLKEENRLTIGGFFQPKNIVFSNEENTLHETTSLMHDLKQKEQEILELTTHLKLTQAEERLKHAEEKAKIAEVECLNAFKARDAAEEKAIFALSKAQTATDYSRVAEERALQAEQAIFKHEQTIKHLEEKLVENEENFQSQLERREVHGQNMAVKNSHLSVSLSQIEEENQLAEGKLMLAAEQNMVLFKQIETLEIELREEKTLVLNREQEIASLQERMKQYPVDKMLLALNSERKLRKLYEEKAKEAYHQMHSIDMQRKAEEYARRAAEEKTKQTLEQASKAVMQLLSTPQN